MTGTRSSARGLLAALIALSLVGVFAGSGGAATNTPATANASATFSDPAGDAVGGAPDITTVAVSDDPATARITIQVTATGFAAVSADRYPTVAVYFDVDKNPSTGSPADDGAEYRLIVQRQPSGGVWNLSSWNGSSWVMPSSDTATEARSSDVVTWTVGKTDLGSPSGFNLSAATFVSDGGSLSGYDLAPDTGAWNYDLSAPPPPPPNVPPVARLTVTPTSVTVGQAVTFDGATSSDSDGRIVSLAWSFGDGGTAAGVTMQHVYSSAGTYTVTLTVTDDDGATGSATQSVTVATLPPPPLKAVIGKPSHSPKKATAGKRFTVTFPVKRSDNGKALKTGTMTCDPKVGRKVVRHSEKFKNGKARLSFVVPKTAAGKLVKVKVTVKVGTKKTTRLAKFRVVRAKPVTKSVAPSAQQTANIRTVLIPSKVVVKTAGQSGTITGSFTSWTTGPVAANQLSLNYFAEQLTQSRPAGGDTLTVTGQLRNLVPQFGKATNAIVGSGQIVVKWTSNTRARVTVNWKLPGGTLGGSATPNSARDTLVIPITRRTGAYKSSGGKSMAITTFTKRGNHYYSSEWTIAVR